MTGTGAYYYITWGVWLRHCLNGKENEYELKWPSLWVMPECVRLENANGATKDVANGPAGRRKAQ